MKRSTLRGVLIVCAAAVLLAGGFPLVNHLARMRAKTAAESGDVTAPTGNRAIYQAVTIGGREYPLNPDISTLLLIGVDDMELEQHEGYRNQALADYLALVVFNNVEKTCTILQIDRNTMAKVPVLGEGGKLIGTATQQICYAHAYGNGLQLSCENVMDAVSQLLYGIPIRNYVSLTMGAIVSLNDTAGGVTVTIEDDFTGVDDTLIQGETVHLMGEHAYNFVHARMQMADDANTSRMRRQAAYVTALAEVLREKVQKDYSFAAELYRAVENYMVTNCVLDKLASLGRNLSAYTLEGFVSPEGQNVRNELVEFYPDEQKLQQLVIDLFCLPVQ